MKFVQLLLVALLVGILFSIFMKARRSNTGVPAEEGEPLKRGDRVFVEGGYSMRPEWLDGKDGYAGTLERFIPGQNQKPDAVIRLDETITAEGISGDMLVMSLRYTDAAWRSGAIAHIELCDFEPDSARWQDRRQGKWIEAAASVRLLED